MVLYLYFIIYRYLAVSAERSEIERRRGLQGLCCSALSNSGLMVDETPVSLGTQKHHVRDLCGGQDDLGELLYPVPSCHVQPW